MLCGRGPATGTADRAHRLETLLGALGSGVRALVWGEQVHGAVIASLGEEAGQRLTGVCCAGRCDGLITDLPGVAVVVWTADCVPLVLAGGGVVAAVHAGWRGAAAGIVARAVRRLEVEYGVTATHLDAVIGPAVGPCHYPVGPEVVTALAAAAPDRAAWLHGDRVDLRGHVAAALAGAGVPPERVGIVGGCTACAPDLASYRRDGSAANRQWTLAVIPVRP